MCIARRCCLWLIREAGGRSRDRAAGWPSDVPAPAGFGRRGVDRDMPARADGVAPEFVGLPVSPQPLVRPPPRTEAA